MSNIFGSYSFSVSSDITRMVSKFSSTPSEQEIKPVYNRLPMFFEQSQIVKKILLFDENDCKERLNSFSLQHPYIQFQMDDANGYVIHKFRFDQYIKTSSEFDEFVNSCLKSEVIRFLSGENVLISIIFCERKGYNIIGQIKHIVEASNESLIDQDRRVLSMNEEKDYISISETTSMLAVSNGIKKRTSELVVSYLDSSEAINMNLISNGKKPRKITKAVRAVERVVKSTARQIYILDYSPLALPQLQALAVHSATKYPDVRSADFHFNVKQGKTGNLFIDENDKSILNKM